MRHRTAGRKLNRTSNHRKAMFANMTVSLLKHEQIQTTLPKAKELRRFADRMITLGKQQSLHARDGYTGREQRTRRGGLVPVGTLQLRDFLHRVAVLVVDPPTHLHRADQHQHHDRDLQDTRDLDRARCHAAAASARCRPRASVSISASRCASERKQASYAEGGK